MILLGDAMKQKISKQKEYTHKTLKIKYKAHRLFLPREMFTQILFFFLGVFVFELTARTGADGRTDGQDS